MSVQQSSMQRHAGYLTLEETAPSRSQRAGRWREAQQAGWETTGQRIYVGSTSLSLYCAGGALHDTLAAPKTKRSGNSYQEMPVSRDRACLPNGI